MTRKTVLNTFFKCFFIFIILSSFFLMRTVRSIPRVDLLVETKVGLIRGLAAADGDYVMFLGIPYGVLNGSNAFGAASPHPKFETIFEAYDDSAMCPQIYQSVIRGTLDCLQLHIYVPSSASSENRLTVMVWLYGGGFMNGYAGRTLYGPKFLVKHDVILITVNYRVNAYGFMCLDIPEVPGNQGLKDQLLAFQWIKENIGAFGGDADKITLFGESAGGHAIDLHLIYSKDKLYDKVILQSGSAYAATVLYEPDKNAPIKIAAYLGFKTNDLQQALDYLTTTNSDSVIAGALNTGIQFKPCVEINTPDAFITTSWLNITNIPKVSGMPFLLGFNRDESMLSHVNKDLQYFSDLDIIKKHFKRIFDFDDNKLANMERVVHNFYFGDEEMSPSIEWDVVEYDSDFTYIHPIQRTLRNYLRSNAGNIYYYMFSYAGERNYRKRSLNLTSLPGAAHADELGYLFDIEFLTHVYNEEDQIIVDRITKMWTNFAKTGDPTPETSDLLPVKWTAVTKEKFHYLDINTELKMGSRPLNERMAFWDIFYKLNEQLQTGYL